MKSLRYLGEVDLREGETLEIFGNVPQLHPSNIMWLGRKGKF